MAIIFFDDFKFDNTNLTIPATQWGVFDSQGTVNVTSTYTKNGYSPNGLDLSISADSAKNGYTYVSKNNITVSNKLYLEGFLGRTTVGFHIDKYPYSGSDVTEPQLSSDMTKYSSLPSMNRAVYSGNGKTMVTARFDTSTSNYIIEYYTKNSDGSFGSAVNLRTLAATNSSVNNIMTSPDGHYLLIIIPTGVYLYKFNSNNTLSPVTFSAPAGTTITGACFGYGNSIILGVTATPYLYFYARTISSDVWTKSPDPATLPTGPVSNITFSSVGYIYGTYSVAPYMVLYYYTGFTPTIQTWSGSLTSTPSALAVYGSSNLAIGYTNSSFLQVTTYNGATNKSIDVLPTTTVTSLSFSPDGSVLTVGQANIQPITYRTTISGSSLTKIPNNLPTQGLVFHAYSSDANFMTAVSTVSPYIYSYDRQVNTIAILSSNDSGATVSDNYAYAGSTRVSLHKKDNIIFAKLYDSINNSIIVSQNFDSLTCATDEDFSNTYLQLSAWQGTTTSSTFYLNCGSLSRGGAANYYSNPFSSLLNGKVAVALKRDINTSVPATINLNITDFYVSDATGIENNDILGPVTVVSENLVSDNSVQWSSTGANNYGVLSNPTPSDSSFVYSTAIGDSDTINVDITSESSSTVYASKVSAISKITGAGSDKLLLTSTGIGANLPLSNNFAQYDLTYEPHCNYVCVSQASGVPAIVLKINYTVLSSYSLPINGYASVAANYTALSPDATYLAVAYSASPYLQIFRNDFSLKATLPDNYNLISGPAMSFAVLFVEFSLDGRYLAVVTASNVYIYKNNNGSFTLCGSTSFTNATCIKFSKGSKYLFVGSATAGSSRVISINSANDTITVLNQVTEAYTSIDTVAYIDGSVEVVVLGKAAAPFISFYKFTNNDVFTAAPTVTGVTVAPNQVILPYKMQASTYVYVDFDQNSASNYRISYTLSTNTVGTVASSTATSSTVLKGMYINDTTIAYLNGNTVYWQNAYPYYPFDTTHTSNGIYSGQSIKNINYAYFSKSNTNTINYTHM